MACLECFPKMAEKSFWIQYDDKTPVKIENLYVNDQKRQRPLTDVGDLIAAYKTQTLPRFQNVPLDELSLYWCGSDGNTPKKLDSDILLTDLGESGSTIKKALIIMEGLN